MRESLHGDKLKRRQRELRSWAEGAAVLHVLNQLDTTVDEFLQVHLAEVDLLYLHPPDFVYLLTMGPKGRFSGSSEWQSMYTQSSPTYMLVAAS